MENPIKMDDLGVPLSLATPIFVFGSQLSTWDTSQPSGYVVRLGVKFSAKKVWFFGG